MNALRLAYLPVNCAWAFTFGDSIIDMGNEGRYLFMERTDAIAAANRCGLEVRGSGEVFAIDPSTSED